MFKKKKHYIQKYLYILGVGLELQFYELDAKDIAFLAERMVDELYATRERLETNDSSSVA